MNSSDAALIKEGQLLPLMEAFYSIQGEGFHTGKAAYFLRIGGCDVGCHWCDVKESWDANLHPLTEVEEIIKLILPDDKIIFVFPFVIKFSIFAAASYF